MIIESASLFSIVSFNSFLNVKALVGDCEIFSDLRLQLYMEPTESVLDDGGHEEGRGDERGGDQDEEQRAAGHHHARALALLLAPAHGSADTDVVMGVCSGDWEMYCEAPSPDLLSPHDFLVEWGEIMID